jgi:hypothetical protein
MTMNKNAGNAGGGAVYGLGLVGALIYYLQHAGGSWEAVVIGIVKAIVWPALLIYKVLGFLGM